MSNIYVDGVFDLLHLGHIDLFKTIKGENDKLIVGVINDKNVQSYKRLPVQNLQHRVEMLRNIKIVDTKIIKSNTNLLKEKYRSIEVKTLNDKKNKKEHKDSNKYLFLNNQLRLILLSLKESM